MDISKEVKLHGPFPLKEVGLIAAVYFLMSFPMNVLNCSTPSSALANEVVVPVAYLLAVCFQIYWSVSYQMSVDENAVASGNSQIPWSKIRQARLRSGLMPGLQLIATDGKRLRIRKNAPGYERAFELARRKLSERGLQVDSSVVKSDQAALALVGAIIISGIILNPYRIFENRSSILADAERNGCSVTASLMRSIGASNH